MPAPKKTPMNITLINNMNGPIERLATKKSPLVPRKKRALRMPSPSNSNKKGTNSSSHSKIDELPQVADEEVVLL